MQRLQFNFAQTGQRAGVHPAQVVGDLGQADRRGLQLAGQRHGDILRADMGEEILRRRKGQAGVLAQCLIEARGKVGVGVDAGTHGSAALGQALQAGLQLAQVVDVLLDLVSPGVQALAHAHRHGVHQVGAAGFDVLVDAGGLAAGDADQMLQRRQQLLGQFHGGADVDAGGDDVVAALAAVDVVIGADRLAVTAGGQGGEDFVGIHVGAGTGAGLKDIDRKMRHEIGGQ